LPVDTAAAFSHLQHVRRSSLATRCLRARIDMNRWAHFHEGCDEAQLAEAITPGTRRYGVEHALCDVMDPLAMIDPRFSHIYLLQWHDGAHWSGYPESRSRP